MSLAEGDVLMGNIGSPVKTNWGYIVCSAQSSFGLGPNGESMEHQENPGSGEASIRFDETSGNSGNSPMCLLVLVLSVPFLDSVKG